MILQEEFENNGYINLLEGMNAQNNAIELEDLFDLEQKQEELIGIFLSKHKDELFILLNADLCDINQLCDKWDDLIRGFIIMNADSKVVRKFQYNIIQLIIYSSDSVDKNCETNLMISRKIIIKGDMTDLTRIYIDDSEVVELPFHMILPDSGTDENEMERKQKEERLKSLLPKDKKVLDILENTVKKSPTIKMEGKTTKYFDIEKFDKIKEWLEA